MSVVKSITDDELNNIIAKAKKAKKSLGLGHWFVFPEDAFTFQITTASGPHRGLHIAQCMRGEDAEFVAALVNAFPTICKRITSSVDTADDNLTQDLAIMIRRLCAVKTEKARTEIVNLALALLQKHGLQGDILRK